MNKKRLGLILLWLAIFFVISFGVLVIVGFHSNLLVTKTLRIIFSILLVVFLILLGFSIYLITEYKYYLLFKKWKIVLISVLLGLYLLGCSTFIFLLYGPYNGFRNWLVTTAMSTYKHKYYCQWFYSEDEINRVLDDNYIKENEEATDASLIDFEKKYGHLTEYDKKILIHKKNATYKIIRFTVNGQKAYLAAIYDPSKISVATTKSIGVSGEYAVDIAKRNKAVLAVNGGGFFDPNYTSNGSTPIGVTISNGKIITDYPTRSYSVIGFSNDNVLMINRSINAQQALDLGYRDAVTMNPVLIVNGTPSFIRGNGGWGCAARTAIGQREDGIVLLLVVDSNVTRTKGASMVDLTEIMQNYGAINAANLDGGTSAVMIEKGVLISDPINSAGLHKTRPIPTIFMVKK